MAPKKKGNKKAQDDWEAELGETIPPANGDESPAPAAENEDAAGEDDGPAAEPAFAAPVEANMDEEFALPEKKGKGGKGKQQQQAAAKAGGDDDHDASGRYLTKAQKEEKARNELKLQQMIAAGIKIGGPADGEAAKKPKFDKKSKGKKQEKIDEDKALAEAAERARKQAEEVARKKEEEERIAREKAEAEAAAKAAAAKEDDIEDDWEAAAASDDDVKDSWDADSDEEGEKDENKDNKANAEAGKAQTLQENDEDSDESSSDESSDDGAEVQRRKEALARREKLHQAALAARSKDDLRSPICCILGHVDTGKTKLLDKIRQTNVQEGEAGGITQQIGATYFPVDAIKQKTHVVNKDGKFEFKVPGLLIIDTPGHESFSNLRSRGSSLCNIAILVVDIMHGLEPQTLESMKLLRDRKTPFVVALNKIDRLYGWKKIDNNGFQESLALQNKAVQNEFKNRLEQTKIAFAEQGFNAELFYENKSMAKYVSLIPTSAHTGEGIPDMLKLIVQLTQERMVGSLMYLSECQATVLEVKQIEGFGMTIDVILSNGVLREGDRILLCGTEGVIKTNIRALLTPEKLKELRLKSQYVHNKEVKAALGVKIVAPGLEKAIAGSRLLSLFSRVERTGRGVSVQASTLGSLEALLDFLKSCKIPVANVGIGPISKRDVMQCGIMLEKSPDYAVMLAFDVKVEKDAASYAEENGIKIFTADIIYHLFDQFTKHMDDLLEKKKEDSKMLAVFPCVLKTVAVFNKTGPIVVGVDVVEGQLKVNTPIAAVKTNPTTGLKEVKGQPSVAVKIEMGGHQPTYGRQLEEADTLYSQISRASINCLKEFYRKDVSNDEWSLIVKLKPVFDIP
ncbi:hypothetical protein VPNG_02946 [Cytospora leucostoma]|uniref:Eukaryotic translation initiation factor 5B n=1 Tax=Cytospora leucostoma TaxID=1230097 RepID=A0A423XGD8_9PEZI|nr:hypothetical protein VPNG_02946 [Cytospora leucostoma]